jgi:hypothetical protein
MAPNERYNRGGAVRAFGKPPRPRLRSALDDPIRVDRIRRQLDVGRSGERNGRCGHHRLFGLPGAIVNIESANRHCERGEAIRRLDCLAAVASRSDDMIREIVICLSQAETRCSRVAGDRRWLFCSFRNATQLR